MTTNTANATPQTIGKATGLIELHLAGYRALEEGCQLHHFELGPDRVGGVRVHRQVLGAADHEVVDVAERLRLADALLAGTLAAVGLAHPDPPAAGPTAERVRTVARHLDELTPRRPNQLTRRVDD